MTSPAFAVFERLLQQVNDVRAAAARDAAAGHGGAGPVLLRSCLVLTVAAFDTYMHEQGVRLLRDNAQRGLAEETAVVKYLRASSNAEVTGQNAEGYIRYRLSYKTLVAPEKVDDLLIAAGLDPAGVWLNASVALGSRPDRLRMQVQVQYDRRNQIAHEGDWDFLAFDFRPLEDAHVNDCLSCIGRLVGTLDDVLP